MDEERSATDAGSVESNSATPDGGVAPLAPPSPPSPPPKGLPSLRTSARMAQSPVEAWTEFALDARRATLDAQGLQISDRQEQSLAARKHLADSTRALRRSVAPDVVKPFSALLKEYQTQIDHLTSRSKAAETAFLDLYRALYEVPDPVPILQHGLSDQTRVLDLEADLRAVQTERDRFKLQCTEAAGNENVIQDLELSLATTKDQMEQRIKSALESKQGEWMEAQAKTVEAYEMREQELIHQISIGNEARRALQQDFDASRTRLSEAQSRVEEQRYARAAESEMVLQDLERARSEVTDLRRKCSQLESRMPTSAEGLAVGDGDETQAKVQDLTMELAEREVQVSQLRDQVDSLNKVLSGQNERKSEDFVRLSNLLKDRDLTISGLQAKIKDLPSADTYHRMKQEYETMEAIQFETTSSANEQGDDAVNSLEQRLLNRSKVLESRVTGMRVEAGEREKLVKELMSKTQHLEEALTDRSELVLKLEDSISSITRDKNSTGGGGRGGDDGPWDVWGSEDAMRASNSDIARKISSASASATAASASEPSMLDIVAGQRDRFRNRSLELEEDNRKLVDRISKMVADTDAVKSDNMQLYEKVRFLQSYSASNPATANSGTGGTGPVAGPPMITSRSSATGPDDEGILSKYKSMYEDIVNPFTVFNRRERHRRFNEMSAPERITVRTGQRLLNNKQSRLFVFFYVLLLHLFVLAVLSYSRFSCIESTVLNTAPPPRPAD